MKKILILLSILVLPSVAYLVLTTGKNNFKHLPVLGEKDLAPNGKDTIYHQVADFNLKDQTGKTITQKDLEGKIYVANFFFATCPGICPKMTSQLWKVQDKFAAVRDLRLVSFTVNPEKDSVKALAIYGKQYLVKPGKWFLLTGDKSQIYSLAPSYLAIVPEPNPVAHDIIHSEKVFLIDKDKRVRGYYDGTDAKEIDRLMDEIRVLLAEYKTK